MTVPVSPEVVCYHDRRKSCGSHTLDPFASINKRSIHHHSRDVSIVDHVQHVTKHLRLENPDAIKVNNPFLFVLVQVSSWSVERVAAWVKSCGFPAEVVEAFASICVDGDLLLQLEEENLRDDLGITNGILRKRFLRELNVLKKSADYSAKDPEDIAGFLKDCVGLEYTVYTYNFLTKGLSLGLMKRLNTSDLQDMLKEAGITSTIHRRRIIEALQDSSCDQELESLSLCSNGSYHSRAASPESIVYVSFDKNSSAELASLVKMQLQFRGFKVYTSDDVRVAACDDVIKEARSFVLVLSNSVNFAPFQCSEIAAALDLRCNLIPLTDDGFEFHEKQLPPEIRPVCGFNAVKWVHDYQDACIDKLERFIRSGDQPKLVESRSSTPSMPIKYLRKDRHQRTVSVESGICTSP